MLPNTLVDIAAVAEKKDEALAALRLAAGRARLRRRDPRPERLPPADALGRGPVEAFRVLTYAGGLDDVVRGAAARDRALGSSPTARAARRRSASSSARATGRRSCARRSRACGRRRRGRGRSSSSTTGAPRRARSPTASATPSTCVLDEPRQRRGRSAAANRGVALATRGAGRVPRRRRPLLSGPPRAPGRRRTGRGPSPSSTRTPSPWSTARARRAGSRASARSSTRSTSTRTTCCSPTTFRSTRCCCPASSSARSAASTRGSTTRRTGTS